MTDALLDPIPPGEILGEEFMAPLDLAAGALAQALRIPTVDLVAVLENRARVDADLALRLARYFGTTPDLWLGLQAEYDLRLAKRSIGPQIERDVQPRAA